MLWLLLIPVLIIAALLFVDFQISAPAYKGPATDHFDGQNFHNPDDYKTSRSRSLWDMLKWAATGNRGEWTRISQDEVDFSVPGKASVTSADTAITFVNHSTFLIQFNGLNILTDPIWSNRASPYTWVGTKRMRPPGVRFEDLPPIDLVLISHNHYDHLDLPTVLKLEAKYQPFFVTPLGVGQFLDKKGVKQTTDLDWWQQQDLNSALKITGMPARHFSGRGVFDRDQTLWCGYMLEAPYQTIYFAGDTAYGSFFTDIGKKFDIDLSIIPIGAYEPRWFMKLIHANPEEAVQIHRDVQSSQSIASHFGTFPLADEAMAAPLDDLTKALEKAEISSNEFQVLDEGETFHHQSVHQDVK